ncbi:MAG TPA: DUF6418 domain-containing protein [Croceibacterium sp.]|nr:DUF6418 domain-containing protein [Croceibacterium sp.]
MIGILLSAAVVSAGADMIEVGAFGDANGSFWIILAFFFAGIEATCLGFRSNIFIFFGEKSPNQSKQEASIIILPIVFTVILLGFFIFFTSGSPILLGVDRVTFWRTIVPENFSFFPSLVIQTYFFLSYYFLYMKMKGEKIFIPSIIIISYIFITIMILGEKFSAFILAISAWMTIISGTFPSFKINSKQLLYISIISLLIISLISVNYAISGRDSSFIFSRIALQSQLMWSLSSDQYGLSMLPSSDWSCFWQCGYFDSGSDYISHRYLPNNVYSFYYDNGTNLSGFTPALPMLTFGFFIAYILNILACLSLGAIQKSIHISIKRENFITSFLLYKVQLGIAIAWFGAIHSAIIGSVFALIFSIVYIFIFGVNNKKAKDAVRFS